MRRLQDGDREAVPFVFRALWPPVLRYCQRLVDGDAEDAAQLALEKIFEQIDRYDPDRPALAWALAVAGWECRTILRRRGRRRTELSADPAEHCTDDGPTPEEALIDARLRDALRDVVATLGERDRSTLEIAFGEALSGHDPTFRQRKSRALARLRLAFRRLYG